LKKEGDGTLLFSALKKIKDGRFLSIFNLRDGANIRVSYLDYFYNLSHYFYIKAMHTIHSIQHFDKHLGPKV
jgi:hypothetical protein